LLNLPAAGREDPEGPFFTQPKKAGFGAAEWVNVDNSVNRSFLFILLFLY